MAVAIIVLTAGVIILRGKMPYKDLKASDIVSATVYFFPPDKTVQITDVEELVSYLGEVTIYNEDHSYNDYCGQTVLFTLTMADGAQEKLQHILRLNHMQGNRCGRHDVVKEQTNGLNWQVLIYI